MYLDYVQQLAVTRVIRAVFGLGECTDPFKWRLILYSAFIPSSVHLFKMGLSGRKEKQRIPADPRNLTWADGK